MATSGTTGTTVFTLQELIDSAHKRAKIPAALITGELIETGKTNLFLIFSALQNQGIPLWRIQRQLRPFYQGQAQIDFLPGTVEVLNANTRILQRLSGVYTSSEGFPELAFDGDLETSCAQAAPDGDIEVDFGSPTTITTFGLLPMVSGTWNFVFEVSQDGITWETILTYTTTPVVAREWMWVDVEITRWPSYQYARLRATGGTILDVIEWFLGNTPQSIPMAPINKDDYFNLPNKTFQGRPVQHWQDVQREGPVLNVWPVPNDAAAFYQVEAQVHRALEDVGTMTQEVDVPNRWLDAIIWSLAEKQADELPEFKGDIDRLERKKNEALNQAWGGIAAKGPIYIQPNISHYTRG